MFFLSTINCGKAYARKIYKNSAVYDKRIGGGIIMAKNKGQQINIKNHSHEEIQDIIVNALLQYDEKKKVKDMIGIIKMLKIRHSKKQK